MERDDSFIPQYGHYENLITYKKAVCIYDISFYFAQNYFSRGDRTVDQMVQAARSGKQNIVEGCAASATSRETEIKLLNVAKASFKELKEDFEDYLRVRNLSRWTQGSEKFETTRKICAKNNDPAYYRSAIQLREPATIANIAIIMLEQEDYLLFKQIEAIKKAFLEKGGIREEMTRARLKARTPARNGQ